jgi:hypothetical protein
VAGEVVVAEDVLGHRLRAVVAERVRGEMTRVVTIVRFRVDGKSAGRCENVSVPVSQSSRARVKQAPTGMPFYQPGSLPSAHHQLDSADRRDSLPREHIEPSRRTIRAW